MPYVAVECSTLEQEFSRIFPVRSITPALQIRTKRVDNRDQCSSILAFLLSQLTLNNYIGFTLGLIIDHFKPHNHARKTIFFFLHSNNLLDLTTYQTITKQIINRPGLQICQRNYLIQIIRGDSQLLITPMLQFKPFAIKMFLGVTFFHSVSQTERLLILVESNHILIMVCLRLL